MDNPTPTRRERKRPALDRLDAAARDLNAVLLVLAIGLAVLDFTCFFAMEIRNAMPPRVPAEAAVAAPAIAVIPPARAAAPRAASGG